MVQNNIIRVQNGGEFFTQMLHVVGDRIRNFFVLPMEWEQSVQQLAKCWAKTVRGSWGRCSTSKQYFAGLWSNSDSDLSQEINAQNGTCHCGLQKFHCKKLALKLKRNPRRGLVGHLLS
jgi:hypothetical protein